MKVRSRRSEQQKILQTAKRFLHDRQWSTVQNAGISPNKPVQLREETPIPSAQVEEDIVETVKSLLATWIADVRIPADHVNKLLPILRILEERLPKTCKTLCHTPKSSTILEMENGQYLHIGVERNLINFLTKNKITPKNIKFDVGIDGVGLAISSSIQLWPIMINVVGFKEVMLVGCFIGDEKPENVDTFLTPFVEEMLNLLETGVTYNEINFILSIRAFVMDAPARAFIMDTMLYSGFHSCTKCVINGVTHCKKRVFPGVGFEL